jgi:predicted DNA binding CopG/RHH family protein
MRRQKEGVPKHSKMPKFADESEEARWWASTEGREFLKQQSGSGTKKPKGSPLVANLSRTSSVQIALRLPAPDLAKAREIADRKGIGYQTLLKMLLHEGLRREARRN